ncbi:MAG TPA: hypothetical protein VKY85_05425 [Candidatus Angelobacter sp.]|nr:hypothetical protein [Candidatus Angelobacter sp.]
MKKHNKLSLNQEIIRNLNLNLAPYALSDTTTQGPPTHPISEVNQCSVGRPLCPPALYGQAIRSERYRDPL